jgi:hypothetical protein
VGVADVSDDSVHPMAEAVGPFYSGAGIRRVLAIRDDGELGRRRHAWEVLAAQTADGVWVYPTFQVDAEGGCVKPWLLELLSQFKGIDRWSAALWLTAPHPDLGGLAPVVAGDEGRPVELITELARQYRHAKLGETDDMPGPKARERASQGSSSPGSTPNQGLNPKQGRTRTDHPG